MLPHPAVTKELIERALQEDLGSGDLTTDSIVPADHRATATITAKAAGVVAGLFMVERTFHALDDEVSMEANVTEGQGVAPGDVVATVRGPARALLMGERTALNFLQRLSGTATRTRQFVEAVAGTGARVCDTRKTVPGLRVLDKYAVRAGGGTNHRLGLFDAVLIKENHVLAGGGISAAVEEARRRIPHTAKVEVECESLADVREALDARVDILMLDNLPLAEMREAVKLVADRAVVEASGNVSLGSVRAVAETGVDLISVGELTHSVIALDLSMRITISGVCLP
ncbi:MAG: nicotinate-nucleotide diphosphorylase (carboxylating) [Armatimonadetes bacterium CG_4_10_14_3_um_filter_66_18]|nr:carboxylating nicotinate-nucleotide diphosphorylase [Armatimonadota bacterium]OIO94819.1 MAG: nicotinate-nucleotide diphosphorylase (carboxylating) [Armatimonadetes bacterium CG2_30_66_41]PIU93683.1 MAG: nicotinate-nucleotide diphosphorylase (carboxylating) [Armatimonadetes bacterium CG06_land_8_20_14_3_00_66_21]PIX47647.1 MAG: nicotinate-nucleotide diphosphorylase (carboxylating) [Armatimonadetes bacterium CG_4_8_14_3_um_filter_66_20]PIY49558.1 MAG: nicotinate-nucleotide diphosphorylase (ca